MADCRLDWLTSEGVFRKLNDLREPSGCAVGLLTTSTLLDAGQDARQLPSLIEHCLSEGYLRPPNASDAMVLNVDFAPTFLEAAGVPVPADMQGRSALSVLRGETPVDWRTSMY